MLKTLALFVAGLLICGMANSQTCTNWLHLPSQPSYVGIGDLDIPGNTVTVEALVNRTTPYFGGPLYSGDIVSKHVDPTDVNYLLRLNSAEITTTNSYYVTPPVCEAELNKTYHVAMVYDGSTLKFYRNGFLMSQVAATGNLVQNNWQTQIGLFDAQALPTNFIGYINEVRIWNVARTQAEIRANMTTSLPSPTTQTGLLAYYTFDNLLNKQGNAAWNGNLGGSATINNTNPTCAVFVADTCCVTPVGTLTASFDNTVFKNSLIQCPGQQTTLYGTITGGTLTNPQYRWQYSSDGFTWTDQPSSNALQIQVTTPGLGALVFYRFVAAEGSFINSTNCKLFSNAIGLSAAAAPIADFSFFQDVCDPTRITFKDESIGGTSLSWDLGNGTTAVNDPAPLVDYAALATYTVKLTASNGGGCSSDAVKQIAIDVIKNNIVITPDTTVCAGDKLQLTAASALSYCWTPATGLSNPTIANPVATVTAPITYYLNAQTTTGTNLVVNGDFSQGNTGFTSAYGYAAINTTEGEYYVGPSPKAWNPSLYNCTDHTTGNGNMMLVNGSPAPDVNVWTQTIAVQPNTNYAFSTWIQALWDPNPAQLSFSINGADIGNLITASLPVCTKDQFYAIWNSGPNTTATISIVNKNTQIQGNDFALDDISFSPIRIERDSVVIGISSFSITANNDTAICANQPVPLLANGGNTYVWKPAGSLSNANIANPVATPSANTQYVVTGTSTIGCTDTDTVNVTVFQKPVILTNHNSLVCPGAPLQLQANNTLASYNWSPAAAFNNAGIYNPIATTDTAIKYTITVTDANNCTYNDSVDVQVRSIKFAVSADGDVCEGNSHKFQATGGDQYTWTPSASLDNANVAAPVASPLTTTVYSVHIQENTCGSDTTIARTVIVNPPPPITVNNDTTICANQPVPLVASGGATYVWKPGPGLSNTTIPNPIATPAVTSQYVVTGTDTKGCAANDTVNITVMQKPVILTTHNALVCADAPLQLAANPALASYAWTPAAALNDAGIYNPIATTNKTTVYTVTVTDANNCTYKDSIDVQVRSIVFGVSSDADICAGSSHTLQATGGDLYTWTPSASLDDASAAMPVATPVTTTTYSVHIQENICGSDTTIARTITVKASPALTISKSNDIDCSTPSAVLDVYGAGKYLWSPANLVDDPKKSHVVASANNTTMFYVTGMNEFGCTTVDSVQVQVTLGGDIIFSVPNAFTPNNDGHNDCLSIKKWGTAVIEEFSIYTRYGERVFSTNDPNKCWDGRYKGQLMEEGGYAYVIRARTLCGPIKRTGMFMLLK